MSSFSDNRSSDATSPSALQSPFDEIQSISLQFNMEIFPVNKSLLNPKFDGYKLELIPQDQAVSRYKLSRKPTQATASGKAPLSFQEMRSRISHNHLTVDGDTGNAVYVDESFNVCLVGIPTSEVSYLKRASVPTEVVYLSAVCKVGSARTVLQGDI